jgi:Tat protein secretion system quality control protein TatD with DNase activity
LIDAHAHPQHAKSPSDCIEGFEGSIFACGTHHQDWHLLRALRKRHERLHIGYGLHPWRCSIHAPIEDQLKGLESLLDEGDFLGEVGLDRSGRHRNSYAVQLDAFKRQLCLAVERELPVAVHLVRAFGDALPLLLDCSKRSRVYLHGYMGSVEFASVCKGFYFGFSEANLALPKVQRAIATLPLDRLLIESDGIPCPESLDRTSERISELTGVSRPRLDGFLADNAERWIWG